MIAKYHWLVQNHNFFNNKKTMDNSPRFKTNIFLSQCSQCSRQSPPSTLLSQCSMLTTRPSWSITSSAPGSDLAGETAAALAAASLYFHRWLSSIYLQRWLSSIYFRRSSSANLFQEVSIIHSISRGYYISSILYPEVITSILFWRSSSSIDPKILRYLS